MGNWNYTRETSDYEVWKTNADYVKHKVSLIARGRDSGITYDLRDAFAEMAKKGMLVDVNGDGFTKKEAYAMYLELDKIHKERNLNRDYTHMAEASIFDYSVSDIKRLAEAAGYKTKENVQRRYICRTDHCGVAEPAVVDTPKFPYKATCQKGIYYDPKTLKHYKYVDGKWQELKVHGESVTQVNKDGSMNTRMTDAKGNLWKSHYDAKGNILSETQYVNGKRICINEYKNNKRVKNLYYNDTNECISVDFYDAQGRETKGSGYNGMSYKSYTTDYKTCIRTFVRPDGSKYYYRVDAKSGYTTYECDAKGNKISE